ncbi:hypothetical protein [Synechococcus phage BUCT-ZZ01]|nr:hypothetical protein [Synechococcus phage BUCT-ZZ01]
MTNLTRKQGFIVGSVHYKTVPSEGYLISISKNPKEHATFESATQEAARLANQNPSKQFIVLRIDATVKMATVVWA